jgi:hypothetical protein
LATEFISNSMVFIPCLILIPLWYPVISVALPNELISSCHFISFIPNEMKWWIPNEPLMYLCQKNYCLVSFKYPFLSNFIVAGLATIRWEGVLACSHAPHNVLYTHAPYVGNCRHHTILRTVPQNRLKALVSLFHTGSIWT